MNGFSRRSQSNSRLSIATLGAILATLAVNTLSNFFPPGGANVGEIANTELQGVRILPANYAFAIWGLIYVGLVAYGVYQLQPAQRRNPLIRRVNVLLIVACLAQIAWIYLFTLRLFWLSIAAMLVILVSLIWAYLHLNVGREAVSSQRRWFANIPFSVYLAWISVATIVNVASALYASGWNGWGLSDITWTVIMLVVGAIVAAGVIWRQGDLAFPLVVVWAYGAIALRQATVSAIWGTAVALAIGLLIFGILRTRRSPRYL